MNKFTLIIILSLSSISNMMSQDVQYSQFYASPLYLNPAFTGTAAGNRASFSFRDQWPSIAGSYVSYALAYDVNLSEFNSGLGFTINHEQAGSGGLNTTNFGISYAYNIQLNKKLFFRPAIGVQYGVKSVDVTKLIFGDQLLTGNSVSINPNIISNSLSFVDINAGVLFYGKDFWLGYSVYHINEPNNSLLIGGINKINARHSIQAGYRIPLSTSLSDQVDKSVTVAMHYKSQGAWNQLDIGGYYYLNPFQIGLWYRGLAKINTNQIGYQNSDAVIVMVGVKFEQIRFMYSYDITVSNLYSDTGGSHEITLIFEFFNPHKGRRKFSQLACPQF